MLHQVYSSSMKAVFIDVPLAPLTMATSDAPAFSSGTRLACRTVCSGLVGRLHSCTTSRMHPELRWPLGLRAKVRC